MDYHNIIERKLDLFFDKAGKNYLNMEIYTQIFDFMEISGLRENEPKLYEAELKRIRDLHNSYTTAFEEGFEKGFQDSRKMEDKIEIAKNALKAGLDIETIIQITNLSKEEIETLKNRDEH